MLERLQDISQNSNHTCHVGLVVALGCGSCVSMKHNRHNCLRLQHSHKVCTQSAQLSCQLGITLGLEFAYPTDMSPILELTSRTSLGVGSCWLLLLECRCCPLWGC